MKNKFSKVLGVVLTLAVLTSLLTVAAPATPASAGTLAYTTEGLPSTVTVNFVDYAVSADGNTIYGVVGTGVIYKSTNGGTSFTNTTVTGASGFNFVAVAPDDANIVVAANATAVWLSTNGIATGGADSWNNAGAPGVVTTIRDLAVSPAVSGVRQVTVAGNAGAGAGISALNLGGTVSAWNNIANGGGVILGATAPVFAIKFSPNFVSDRLLVAVAQDTGSNNVTMNLFRFTTTNPVAGLWNAAAGFTDFTGASASTGQIAGTLTNPTLTTALTSADISLAPTYSGTDAASRNAFVALDAAADGGGVYQVKDAVSKLIGDDVRMRSVAFNGTNLVAGRADNNTTYRSSDALATTPTLTSTTQFQRPSGGLNVVSMNTQVAWAGANVVAATTGNEAAFSISKDNGANYQDVSMYNTTGTATIIDIAVAPDGSKWYAVTTGNATGDPDVNVWAKTGTTWERLMTIVGPVAAGGTNTFTLRQAPENKQVVYLVQNGTTNIYYTDDGGDKNWTLRIANETVVDLAVESAQVVYYINGTNIRKSTNGGFLWNDPAVASLASGSTPISIKSLGKDLLLETATSSGNGVVSYSNNGGTTWTRPASLSSSGVIVATADNLSSGTFIYAAVRGLAGQAIARFKVGSVAPDNVWKAISNNANGTETFSGITLKGGILYAHSYDTAIPVIGAGSFLWRSMNPAEAGETSVVFSKLNAATPNPLSPPDFMVAGGRTDNLQISTASGVNTIWGIDTDSATPEENGDNAAGGTINDEVYSFVDTLTVAPTTVSPVADAVISVNPVSGNTYSVTFTWNRPSLATDYNLQVATDSAFKAVISNTTFGTVSGIPAGFDPAVTPVAATLAAGVTLNPGTTYYFRVRTVQPLFSPWSTTVSFKTASLDAPFALAGPAVGANDVPVQPVLSWSAYPGALWYEVTVSEDPSFAIPEFSHNVKGNLFYGITADEALKNSTTYYWRVRGVTAEPFVKGTAVVTPSGPWATGAFTTVAAAVKAEPPVIVIEKPAPPAEIKTITIEKEVPVPQPIPNWMLMTIIIIGAVLVIALIVLIVRTRRVA